MMKQTRSLNEYIDNMPESGFEKSLKPTLEYAEQSVDGATQSQLTLMRSKALTEKRHWFSEYKKIISTSAITAALFMGVFIFPETEKLLNTEPYIQEIDNSFTLLLEDPEFYLWLDTTGLVSVEP